MESELVEDQVINPRGSYESVLYPTGRQYSCSVCVTVRNILLKQQVEREAGGDH